MPDKNVLDAPRPDPGPRRSRPNLTVASSSATPTPSTRSAPLREATKPGASLSGRQAVEAQMAILMEQEAAERRQQLARGRLYFIKIPLAITGLVILWLLYAFVKMKSH